MGDARTTCSLFSVAVSPAPCRVRARAGGAGGAAACATLPVVRARFSARLSPACAAEGSAERSATDDGRFSLTAAGSAREPATAVAERTMRGDAAGRCEGDACGCLTIACVAEEGRAAAAQGGFVPCTAAAWAARVEAPTWHAAGLVLCRVGAAARAGICRCAFSAERAPAKWPSDAGAARSSIAAPRECRSICATAGASSLGVR